MPKDSAKPAKSKLTISKLKKVAFGWFSKYIRLRDCLKTSGGKDYLICITCGSPSYFKEADAGHFKHGSEAPTYFEEDNVHGQCTKCNLYLSGRLDVYAVKLIDMIGRKRVDELEELRHVSHCWKREELEEIRDKYKQKFLELDNGF